MNYLLIRNATIIDGTGKPPIPRAAVLVEDNRIHSVGTENTLSISGKKAIEIDAQGGFVLPGFIDCHVHLCFDNILRTATEPFSYHFYKVIAPMRRTLEAGVTSVREGGGTDLGMKRAVEDGLIIGPRMQISVHHLGVTGGNIDPRQPSGLDLPIFPARPGFPDPRCDGVDEVRKKAREMLRAGADVLKVLATSGVVGPSASAVTTHFCPEELAVVVQEAAYAGKHVMAHAHTPEGIRNALQAGVHSIEHGIWMHQDEECIKMMAEKGTFFIPTLNVTIWLQELFDSGNTEIFPPQALKKMAGLSEPHRLSVSKAYKAGVRIAMGTDAMGTMHGMNLRELKLMCDIGMTPMEAIVTSTKTASECLGWQKELGTIEKGKLADIVICRKNPLDDIASLSDVNNITTVVKDGKIVKGA